MKLDWMLTSLVFAMVGLSGCGSGGPKQTSTPQPEAVAEREPVEIHRDGAFLVSGQPDAETIKTVAGEGVGTIVSCRSVEEMDALDFDEAALAAELGMKYVHVPMGRDHEYAPGQVTMLTEAMREADGPVYVHCASGGRARYVIMAYLIREQGYSVDQAMETAQRLGRSEPVLDRLLGEQVIYGLTERDLQTAQ